MLRYPYTMRMVVKGRSDQRLVESRIRYEISMISSQAGIDSKSERGIRGRGSAQDTCAILPGRFPKPDNEAIIIDSSANHVFTDLPNLWG